MLVLLQQPIVVDLPPEAGETTRITYPEVILNALGAVGVVMALAIVVGILVGAVIIYRKRRLETVAPVIDSEHTRLRI